jgi:hypothetical protein
VDFQEVSPVQIRLPKCIGRHEANTPCASAIATLGYDILVDELALSWLHVSHVTQHHLLHALRLLLLVVCMSHRSSFVPSQHRLLT